MSIEIGLSIFNQWQNVSFSMLGICCRFEYNELEGSFYRLAISESDHGLDLRLGEPTPSTFTHMHNNQMEIGLSNNHAQNMNAFGL